MAKHVFCAIYLNTQLLVFSNIFENIFKKCI